MDALVRLFTYFISIEGDVLSSEFLEVVLGLVLVRDNSLGSRGPSCRTHDTMLVGVLEGLDGSEGLVNVAADLLVIDGDGPHYSLSVNDE
jgi:hypothetical protein